MRNRFRDRPSPFKTQIAVARRHRDTGDLRRPHTRPMDIELPVTEPIGIAGRPRDQFGAQYRRVKRFRALPIAYMNDTMIEFGRDGHVAVVISLTPKK